MKIKTISDELRWAGDFDRKVNTAQEEGWQLAHRGLVPGFRLDGGGYLHNMLYAELVLPDPEPKQETLDPIQALHIVKEACLAHTDHCNKCPMWLWCEQLRDAGDPTDWELPEVEV